MSESASFPHMDGESPHDCIILCVIPDHFQREQIARVLERVAVNVIVAENGTQAMGLCVAAAPDVLLTDIDLPDMDGLELVGRLRDALPAMDVIVAVGVDEAAEVVRAVDQGADGVLLKPVLPEALMRCVHRSVELVTLRRHAHGAEVSVRTILDANPDFAVLVEDERELYVNEPMCRFLGYADFAELVASGRFVSDFVAEVDGRALESRESWIRQVVDDSLDRRHVLRIPLSHDPEGRGHSFVATYRAFPVAGRFLITLTDITEFEAERRSLHDQASLDPLTGISNRRRFGVLAQDAWRAAEKSGVMPTLIMFDIDHFKRVNDTYGHDVGDEVLRALASAVAEAVRSQDVLARWGGEEFMLLVPDAVGEDAVSMAERLRMRIEKLSIDGVPRGVTSSFGVAVAVPGEDWEAVAIRADEALYRAKQGGRNCVVAAQMPVVSGGK
ncbi:diguanylate cyclase (GGDEF)-like protein [Desulfobaculum xiamenense]|uniref:diguanylate cyclase n=1 Tax=Desulfobaculum xiamenense TaxID=995050 RepID=A0A846QDA6_9BACT|nr:diguanylate cyclase [Desulfobaculum xiamenense]NJB66368.1 diguanylate cyclase (GGDEF)-like protein [Desulfobaculum xiamenense]